MKNSTRTIRSGALGALALAGMLALSACGGTAEAENPAAANASAPLFSQLPEKVQKSGAINVASNVEYPPFESFDTDGTTVIGIDREIADELEKQLGVTMDFDNIAFDAIIPGLASARYDMAMSAMSDTVERQKQVNFIDYFSAGGGVMTSAANAEKLKTLDDLCGSHVGIVKGTTEDADAAEASKKCEEAGKQAVKVTIFAGQNQAVLALQSNRVDAFLVDSTSGSVIAAESKGALAMGERYQDLAFGIVFPKDQEQLMNTIQKGLEAIKADGSYDKILAKYNMADHTMESFPVNGVKQ
ncbi:ABC transporter substrate-binding protein [Paeniglutamicibacter sp. ZC-3]|uniref:ABC transporter substrate-binding protein n=1 Tax=Paeniglutamicibacter TaxID=1742990 RepID=UPI0021F6B88B|nr:MULTISPECIES: ABC transporter substrate-binding protein [Paeniglutamicibacter]MCV9993211.1 ABC transporter substrate-binding protein [Paeniglutamicibacter sp. ZC-3]MDO2933437.1 ABC transporter substrate-binding protein [Paeniglutamicibacter sulfureus]